MTRSSSEPAITVAIPTLGRRDFALEALRTAAAQVTDTPFEILVLDNGCDVRLEQAVSELAQGVAVPVHYIAVQAVGLHNGRHEGARRARGDILAYLDDDVVVQPGWLAGVAEAFADPDVHLVGGRCIPLYESAPPAWLEAFWEQGDDGTLWCGALSLVDPGPEPRDINPLFIFGANFAIRKQTLLRLGGFHPDALPWDLRRFRGDGETAISMAAAKLGLRAAYSPEATVRHRVPSERMSEGYFERRAFLQGISESFTAARSQNHAPAARRTTELSHLIARRLRGAASITRGERVPRDWDTRRATVSRAHAAGYAFHQEQLQTSPEVRAWVLRADYWDATLPDRGSS